MSTHSDYLPESRLFDSSLEDLSSLELLALVLRPGQRESSAFEEAHRVLGRFLSISNLDDTSYPGLRQCGLTHSQAIALMSARLLFREDWSSKITPGQSFRSSSEIFRHFRPRLDELRKECFWTLLLDGKNRIQRIHKVSQGSLTASLVHPREVFRPAILESAAGVLFVHNHPSGDPAPSDEDIRITRRLAETGKVVGIRVLDHVIIGRHGYFSFADQGLL